MYLLQSMYNSEWVCTFYQAHRTQLSEGVHNASLLIPWSITASLLLSGCLGFGLLLAALFSLNNLKATLSNLLPAPRYWKSLSGPRSQSLELPFSLWLPGQPVDAGSMNYSVSVTRKMAIVSVLYYSIWAEREHKGTVIEVN